MTQGRAWRQRVECRDVMGRPAKMLVTVRGDELTVMVPPGESAVFSVDQLEQLLLLRAAVTLGIEDLRSMEELRTRRRRWRK